MIDSFYPEIQQAIDLVEQDADPEGLIFPNLFDPITSSFAVGQGINNADEARAVVAGGYNVVVDCRSESYVRNLWWNVGRGVTFRSFGFLDDGEPKTTREVMDPIMWASGMIESGAKVLVHCAAGVNRGPSIAYGILRWHYRFVPRAAFYAIKGVRPYAHMRYAPDVERAFAARGEM